MNRAILIPGMPDKEDYYNPDSTDCESNRHWFPWLQLKLCQKDILTQALEMPHPYDPNYIEWKIEFDRYSPDENTLLVGHSCGGGFLIRWLSENPDKKVGKVVLVAPWIDIEGRSPNMFLFNLRNDIVNQVVNGIDVLVSTDDKKPMQDTLEKLQKVTTGLTYHRFENYGHFTFGRMKTREFPELLQICLG